MISRAKDTQLTQWLLLEGIELSYGSFLYAARPSCSFSTSQGFALLSHPHPVPLDPAPPASPGPSINPCPGLPLAAVPTHQAPSQNRALHVPFPLSGMLSPKIPAWFCHSLICGFLLKCSLHGESFLVTLFKIVTNPPLLIDIYIFHPRFLCLLGFLLSLVVLHVLTSGHYP